MSVYKATLRCVRNDECVVCAHRVLHRRDDKSGLKPNARPQLCATWIRCSEADPLAVLRSGGKVGKKRKRRGGKNRGGGLLTEEEVKKRKKALDAAVYGKEKSGRVGLYVDGMQILCVGDGDFSFSTSLARNLHLGGDGGAHVTATSHESFGVLRDVYPNFGDVMEELDRHGVEVLHGIDATKLAETLPGSEERLYHRIVFNFPCVAVRDSPANDGQNNEMDANKALVDAFLKSAVPLLHPGGEIHIRHKTKPPFSQWDLPGIISACSDELKETGRIAFDRTVYYPYANRKALDKRSFPASDAETYVVQKKGLCDIEVTFLPDGKPSGAYGILTCTDKVELLVERAIQN